MRRRIGKDIVIVLFWIVVGVNILWFGSRLIDLAINGREIPEVNEQITINDKKDRKGKKRNNVEDSQKEFQEEQGLHYFNQLPEESKDAYEVLLEGLQNREAEITLEGCSSDDLLLLWQSVLMDYPEIFWVDSYRYLEYKDENKCEVQPSYIYTKEEIEEKQEQIQKTVKAIFEDIGKNDSDYDKILHVYEYIVEETEYSMNSSNNQHIDSVLIGKSSVCAGYAKSAKYLLNLLGIDVMYVTGTALDENGEPQNHAWDIVWCEGESYFVDVTWGDPVNNTDESKDIRSTDINYNYLCCNEEQLFVTHTLDSLFTYPSCDSLEWNYYVVNGRYFTEYNAEEIETKIQQDITEGAESSLFKFANSESYEVAKEDLLNVQAPKGKELFNERNNETDTQYSWITNDNTYCITVYWR